MVESQLTIQVDHEERVHIGLAPIDISAKKGYNVLTPGVNTLGRLHSLDVTYKSLKIKQELTDPYGKLLKSNSQRSKLMFRRIEELTSADTLHDLRSTGGGCHELEGDMKGQLAVKLDGGWRLIFEPADDPLPRLAGGGLDWKSVRSVRILEAKDYHNG